jgi:glutaminyl-tRNA synthetase
VRLYDRLLTKANPGEDKEEDFQALLNPKSLETLKPCYLEPSMAGAGVESFYQFERQGYFCVDRDSAPGALVFNRTVTLRDPWAKLQQKEK